jgi:hypothetical protein
MCCTKLLTYACDHSGLSHIKVTSLRFILASSLDFSLWKPSPLLFCAISGPRSRSINLHISFLCYDVLVPISFVFHCLLYVVSPNPVASGTKRNDTAYYLETYANLSTGRRMLHCKEFISHVESFDEMAARRDLSFSPKELLRIKRDPHPLQHLYRAAEAQYSEGEISRCDCEIVLHKPGEVCHVQETIWHSNRNLTAQISGTQITP